MPMQIVTLEPEMPPYSSGNGMPRIPFSANSFSMSFGYSPVWSISAARGATRSWTSSRIVSLMATCSGVNSKSIWAGLSGLQQIARDHDPLHLVGTLVDLERFRVADVSFEWASGAGAVVAGGLQCVERNLRRSGRDVELRQRCLPRERPAAAAQPFGPVRQPAGRVAAGRQVVGREVVDL